VAFVRIRGDRRGSAAGMGAADTLRHSVIGSNPPTEATDATTIN
jgi:hypothetical protein